MACSSSLIRAKITPPRYRLPLLERDSLIQKLNGVSPGSTVIVRAPSGYGKSLLLAQWRNKMKLNKQPCAWVNLDREDDPDTVLAHIAYSFHSIGIDMSDTGLLDNRSHNNYSLPDKMGLLFAVLTEQRQGLHIIFDDTDRASPQVVEYIFAHFLRWAPEGLTVLLSGRKVLKLNTCDLALRGLLVEIGSDELRYSNEELMALLSEGERPELKFIQRESHNWPALVQLIRLSGVLAQGKRLLTEQALELPQRFNGYIDQLISSAVSEEQLTFLLNASVFDYVPMALFQDHNDESILNHITLSSELSEFISPVEGNPSLLQIHPLLRKRLEDRLKVTCPKKWVFMHIKAANWYVEERLELRAVQHAVQVNDPALVESVLCRLGGPAWILFQQPEALRQLDALLPSIRMNVVAQHPGRYPLIALAELMTKVTLGEMAQANEICQQLIEQTALLTSTLGQPHKLAQFSLALAKSALDYYSGNRLDPQWVEKLTFDEDPSLTSTHYLRAFISNVHAVFANEYSKLKQSVVCAQRGLGQFRLAGSKSGEAYTLLLKAAAEMALGRNAGLTLTVAKSVIDHTSKSHGEIRFAYSVIACEASVQAAPYSVDNIESFVSGFYTVIGESNLWFHYCAAACQLIVDSAYLQNKLQLLNSFFQTMTHLFQRRQLGRLNRYVNTLRACHLARAGELQKAKSLLSSQPSHLGRLDLTWKEAEAMAELHILLGSNNPGELSLVNASRETSVKAHNIPMQLRLQFAHIQYLYARADYSEVIAQLSLVCDLVLEFHYYREAAVYCKVLKTLRADTQVCRLDRVEGVLLRLDKILVRVQTAKNAFLNRLTAKEQEVIDGLSNGYSNKVIARCLNISPNTVGFHLKNIYRKLGVSTCQDAVASAFKGKG